MGTADIERTMTGAERVLAALEHREPDRVPLDLCQTEVSGINRGGYVFAPIHDIQSGVPVENVMTMLETHQEFGIY